MCRKWIGWVALAIIIEMIAPLAKALAAADEFYRGKVIRVVVGFSAGGGFDTYARLVARYMGNYVPGNPGMVVENMTGAGSLIAANHVYKVARPDGLTIGSFNGNQILGQLVGAQGINFDARKMEWIGAPGYNHDLCVLNRQSAINSAQQWLTSKTPPKLGGSAPGTPTDDVPKVLKEAIRCESSAATKAPPIFGWRSNPAKWTGFAAFPGLRSGPPGAKP
jgi:tripartite-type tricarboxylate transporter receptor subunit TctC